MMIKIATLYFWIMVLVTIAVCYAIYKNRKEGDADLKALERCYFTFLALLALQIPILSMINIVTNATWIVTIIMPFYITTILSIAAVRIYWINYRMRKGVEPNDQ